MSFTGLAIVFSLPAVCGVWPAVSQHHGSILKEKKLCLSWYQKVAEDVCCFDLLQTFQNGQVPFQMTADVLDDKRIFKMRKYTT